VGSGSGLGGVELPDVLGADVVGAVEAQEWGGTRGGFDGRAAVGLFALDNADDCGDGHAGFVRGINRIDGGGAGGADIVHDHDARTFTEEAFNAATGAVGLFRLANQEAVQQRRAGMLLGAPGAGRGHIRHDGVGPHGQAAHSFGFDLVGFEKLKDGMPGEAAAFGVQRGGAAVDVVVAGAAGGELELAELEAGAGEQGEQLLGVVIFFGHCSHILNCASHCARSEFVLEFGAHRSLQCSASRRSMRKLAWISRLTVGIQLCVLGSIAPAIESRAETSTTPQLEALPCDKLAEMVNNNRLYRTYLKSIALTAEAKLVGWDWSKIPPNWIVDPSDLKNNPRPLPMMNKEAVFEKKEIHCSFGTRAPLGGAIFKGSDLTGSTFNDAVLTDASFDRWGGDGHPTVLRRVNFSGADLTGASFDYADMTDVNFEPSKLPTAKEIASADHLELMTYNHDPSALAALRALFRDGGFSDQDRKINCAIRRRQQQQLLSNCRPFATYDPRGLGSCNDYLGSKIVDLTCQFGMDLWRPVTIGLWSWGLFTMVFFMFMHHPGPSGLYLAVAAGLTLDPDDIPNAPQVRSSVAQELWQKRDVLGWVREEIRLLRVAGFFSLVNGFNLGFKDADVGRWIRLLPGREFEFRAVGWARTMAGLQALLTLYLLAVWVLCLFGHPFG
jgi:Pentapeptide repeats (8 copies)